MSPFQLWLSSHACPKTGRVVFDMTAKACSTTHRHLDFNGASSDSGIEGDGEAGLDLHPTPELLRDALEALPVRPPTCAPGAGLCTILRCSPRRRR